MHRLSPDGPAARFLRFRLVLLCFLFVVTAVFPALAGSRSLPKDVGSPFDMAQGLEGAEPVLQILYVSSTQGETLPCPVCRGGPPGGLSRRAGLFDQYRHSGAPLLILAGPDEFLTDPASRGEEKRAMPSLTDGKIALAAYTALRVDAGWLSPEAAEWMRQAGGDVPPGFTVVEKEPQTRMVSTPAGPVGIVFFPRGERQGVNPSREQEKAVLDAGKALRKKAFLVIGVSPWGHQLEKAFLSKAEGIFGCLFGSGPGVAFSHAIPPSAPGILWLRSDTRGRSVTELRLLSTPPPPASGKSPDWIEGISFTARLIPLDAKVPENKDVAALLGKD